MSKKAIIRLTNTMLNKSIIDANKTVCDLAEEFDFKYSDADAGDRFELVGKYKDNTKCKVSFYKAKGRGDKRISITGLKKFAEVGDTVTLKTRGKDWKNHPWQVNIIITNDK
tara:strand:- start:1096 stop:1431 length:336 start_codon:yes stop_codon:yes gene_type:complete